MKKQMKQLLALTLTLALVLVTSTANAVTTFPPGFLIGDNDGIRVTPDGEYMIYATGMQAGDEIKKTLSISNTEHSTFALSMTATPLTQTGPIELLDKIHLRLLLDGKEIYSGRVYGDGNKNMITNALQLGSYSYGDSKTMQIELKLDDNLSQDLFKKKSIAEIRWNFYAVKQSDSIPPKTGETVNNTLILCSALFIALSLLLNRQLRRGKKSNKH